MEGTFTRFLRFCEAAHKINVMHVFTMIETNCEHFGDHEFHPNVDISFCIVDFVGGFQQSYYTASCTEYYILISIRYIRHVLYVKKIT